MDGPPLPVLIPLLVAAFLAFFAGVLLLLAHLSGWRALSGRYRTGTGAGGAGVALCSGRMRWWFLPVDFGAVLHVTAGPQGVRLSVLPPFSAAFPPLAIPWAEMQHCRTWRLFGFLPRFQFVATTPAVTVTLTGRAATYVQQEYARWNPGSVPQGSPWR